jgi:hypothetical protein
MLLGVNFEEDEGEFRIKNLVEVVQARLKLWKQPLRLGSGDRERLGIHSRR